MLVWDTKPGHCVLSPAGLGGVLIGGPGQPRPTNPPTHIEKNFPRGRNEMPDKAPGKETSDVEAETAVGRHTL